MDVDGTKWIPVDKCLHIPKKANDLWMMIFHIFRFTYLGDSHRGGPGRSAALQPFTQPGSAWMGFQSLCHGLRHLDAIRLGE